MRHDTARLGIADGGFEPFPLRVDSLLPLVALEQARSPAVPYEREAAALNRAREWERAGIALQATIDAVSDLGSLEAFIPQALRIVVRAFGAKSAAYWEHSSDTIYLRHWLVDDQVFGPTVLPGLDPSRYGLLARLASGFTVPPDHLGVHFRERNRPTVIHHRSAAASPELHSFAQSMGWDWEINVPLLVGGVAEGALTLYRSEADPFSETDVALAEALAKQIALAMKISRIAEREREISVARERAAELSRANQVLRRSVDRVADDRQIEQLVSSFLVDAVEAMGCSGGAVMVRVERSSTTFRPAAVVSQGRLIDAARVASDPHLGHFVELSPGDPGLFSTLAAGNTQWARVESLRESMPIACEYHRLQEDEMIWHAPLRIRGEVLGYVALTFRDTREPSQTRQETVTALATQLALALKLTEIANQTKLTAIAFERERIAQQRAIELARSNEALQSTIDVLATAESLEEFVPSVLRLVSGAFDSDGCAYYEQHAGQPIYLRYWLWNGAVLGPQELRQLSSDDDRGFLAAMARGFTLPAVYSDDQARNGRMEVLVDHSNLAANELEIDRFYLAHDLGLELRVPLIVGGRSDGALVIRRRASQPFSESEVALAANVGKQLALATQSHRLAERARVESLTRAQEQAVARERERLSRDIHDTLAQGYAAILVHAQAMKLSLRAESLLPVQSSVEVFEQIAKQNLVHARRTMEDLRADPFGRVTLGVTLQQCATEEAVTNAFSVELESPPEGLMIPRYVEIEIRRIVKEALSNARRHARTGSAVVQVRAIEGRCTIRIIDRGVGFRPDSVDASFGIRGMRERAARAGADLAIESSPDYGTIVTLAMDMETWLNDSPR